MCRLIKMRCMSVLSVLFAVRLLGESIITCESSMILRKQTNQQIYTSLLRQPDAGIRTTLQGTGAVGHSFPGLSSCITCHYRFAEMLAIKRTSHAIIFSEARDNVKYFKSHTVYHFCFPQQYEALFEGIFILSFPSSHSRRSQGHCHCHPACQVHLSLMNSKLK